MKTNTRPTNTLLIAGMFLLLSNPVNAQDAPKESAAQSVPVTEKVEQTEDTPQPAAESKEAAQPAVATDEEEDKNKNPHIARASFTTAIEDKEPVDEIVMLPSKYNEVFFFTDLRNFQGQKITHRWEYKGKVMAEVPFDVDGPRWRVYSSKTLQPEWTGIWSVVILNHEGAPIEISSFEVTE